MAIVLHLALGHASFDAMLEERNVMSPSTARALIRLVTTMSRDEALAYGQEKTCRRQAPRSHVIDDGCGPYVASSPA